MTNILMPSMGENVKEGIIINISVKQGEIVRNGQTLLEVETDKVTFEVPAEDSGKITEIFVQKGARVSPGDLLAKLEMTTADTAKPSSNGTLVQEINNGVTNEAFAVTTKYVAEKEAVKEQPAEKKDLLISLESKKIISTPLARKLARELDIEIAEVQKTINKRVSFNDVKIYAKEKIRELNGNGRHTYASPAPTLPDFEKFGSLHRLQMAPITIATSRNMTISSQNIPHAWIQEKIDITDLEASRKKHKDQVGQAGGSLTITALVVKAVAQALQAFSLVNSSLDTEKNEIIIKDHFHIGVAVDTERGLLVPVIRDVDKRNLTSIAVELARISKDARDKKTKMEDLEGATFTISNLGGIGTTGINPIVNWPQVGILGLSAGQIEPVWIENQFVPRLRMPVTLGFDHRVLNGAEAARFLQYLKKALEDPFLLLL